MRFADRTQAGQRLAGILGQHHGADVVVLGLPRGGVPVAFEVASALGAPLDVIVVRKLGVPAQPELAMGAIGEDGVRVTNDAVIRRGGITDQEIAEVEQRERTDLDLLARQFRSVRGRLDLTGRTAILVDDGVATGSTAAAACQVARQLGAARVVLAVPVGAPQSLAALQAVCDEVTCLHAPELFQAVGPFYDDFGPVPDAAVTGLLAHAAAAVKVPAGRVRASSAGPAAIPRAALSPEKISTTFITQTSARSAPPPARDDQVVIEAAGVTLAGQLVIPANSTSIIIFVPGSDSGRDSPRARYLAARLNDAGLGTLLLDLLTEAERSRPAGGFDVAMLASRLIDVTGWLRQRPGGLHAAIGYFGASTGAAVALWAAAEPGAHIDAVVCRGGRADLAGPRLAAVSSPTLLVVGELDQIVLRLSAQAQQELRCEHRLAIVPAATHLFEEPGALGTVSRLARDWFTGHFGPPG